MKLRKKERESERDVHGTKVDGKLFLTIRSIHERFSNEIEIQTRPRWK